MLYPNAHSQCDNLVEMKNLDLKISGIGKTRNTIVSKRPGLRYFAQEITLWESLQILLFLVFFTLCGDFFQLLHLSFCYKSWSCKNVQGPGKRGTIFHPIKWNILWLISQSPGHSTNNMTFSLLQFSYLKQQNNSRPWSKGPKGPQAKVGGVK